jgi:restriction system protein
MAFSPDFSGDFSLDFSHFVGREREFRWLEEHVAGYRGQGVAVVHGHPGVGKTSLVQQWFRTRSRRRTVGWLTTTPHWFSAASTPDPSTNLSLFVEQLLSEQVPEQRRELRDWVVLDDSEMLTDEQLRSATGRLLNRKRIQSVVILSRRRPELQRAEFLNLEAFGEAESIELLKRLLGSSALSHDFLAAFKGMGGTPQSIAVLAQLLRGSGGSSVEDVLAKPLYQAPELVLPESKLIAIVAPKIISANEALIEKLRDNPDELYDLHPRRFEEIVAELFSGMGARVELTPITRDGGRDILVFWKLKVGEMLCLVDTKRYRPDRKVTVGMVRTLYGTFTHYQTNSAMLVTTSSFTKDAKEFREEHKHQLDLKEYSHIVSWLQDHKQP